MAINKLWVIKIGGNIIDHPEGLSRFLDRFATLRGRKVLIHGGGKIATRMAADLGIEATLVAGRRITDEAMLRVVTMVYAGLTNKQIDRKSTRLNSSHVKNSYAVFCLKKKIPRK